MYKEYTTEKLNDLKSNTKTLFNFSIIFFFLNSFVYIVDILLQTVDYTSHFLVFGMLYCFNEFRKSRANLKLIEQELKSRQ